MPVNLLGWCDHSAHFGRIAKWSNQFQRNAQVGTWSHRFVHCSAHLYGDFTLRVSYVKDPENQNREQSPALSRKNPYSLPTTSALGRSDRLCEHFQNDQHYLTDSKNFLRLPKCDILLDDSSDYRELVQHN